MMQAPFVRRSFGSQPFLAGLLLFLALAIVIASAARAGSGRRERSDDSNTGLQR